MAQPTPLSARARLARLRAGFQTEAAAAAAIGCSRPLVIAWENGNAKSIGGKYLLAAAKAYRVRPEWLSGETTQDGYPWGEEAASQSQSQPAQLNPVIVRVVARALREVFHEELGRRYSIEENPELFAEFYERTVARGDTASNLVWLGMRIKEIALQGALGDERRGNASNGKSDDSRDTGHQHAKA